MVTVVAMVTVSICIATMLMYAVYTAILVRKWTFLYCNICTYIHLFFGALW